MGKKKTKKMRGSKTNGYGSKKKHRGGGSRGGRGLAGGLKHKKLLILKNYPNHFGRTGFKRKNKKTVKTINLKDLDIIAKKLNKKEINIKELGYDKVLGKGKLTNPIKIESKSFSSIAKEKIEKAGGKAIEVS